MPEWFLIVLLLSGAIGPIQGVPQCTPEMKSAGGSVPPMQICMDSRYLELMTPGVQESIRQYQANPAPDLQPISQQPNPAPMGNMRKTVDLVKTPITRRKSVVKTSKSWLSPAQRKSIYESLRQVMRSTRPVKPEEKVVFRKNAAFNPDMEAILTVERMLRTARASKASQAKTEELPAIESDTAPQETPPPSEQVVSSKRKKKISSQKHYKARASLPPKNPEKIALRADSNVIADNADNSNLADDKVIVSTVKEVSSSKSPVRKQSNHAAISVQRKVESRQASLQKSPKKPTVRADYSEVNTDTDIGDMDNVDYDSTEETIVSSVQKRKDRGDVPLMMDDYPGYDTDGLRFESRRSKPHYIQKGDKKYKYSLPYFSHLKGRPQNSLKTLHYNLPPASRRKYSSTIVKKLQRRGGSDLVRRRSMKHRKMYRTASQAQQRTASKVQSPKPTNKRKTSKDSLKRKSLLKTKTSKETKVTENKRKYTHGPQQGDSNVLYPVEPYYKGRPLPAGYWIFSPAAWYYDGKPKAAVHSRDLPPQLRKQIAEVKTE